MTNPLTPVRALFFDVFGTVVDWRSTVTATLHARAQQTLYLADECSMPGPARAKADSMGLDDWGRFADEWRQMYYVFTRGVAQAAAEGRMGDAYKNIDTFQLESLGEMLGKWGLGGLWDASTVREVSRVWHALDPWPDSVEGIQRLNEKGYATCSLSNGNVELLSDMAKHAGLEWGHVFSAEMFQSYKPNPAVYRGAANRLGLKAEECAMVAAHLGDLEAARKVGLKTVYVEREREEAWEEKNAEQARDWVDVWVGKGEGGFITVAEALPGVQE